MIVITSRTRGGLNEKINRKCSHSEQTPYDLLLSITGATGHPSAVCGTVLLCDARRLHHTGDSSRLIRIFQMSFTCTSSVGRGQGDIPIKFQKRFSRSYAEIPLGIRPSNPAPEGNYPEPMATGEGENRDPSAIHVLSVT